MAINNVDSSESEVQKLLDAKVYNLNVDYLEQDKNMIQRISDRAQKSVRSIRKETDYEYGSSLKDMYQYIDETKTKRQLVYGALSDLEKKEKSLLQTSGGMRGLSDIAGSDYEKMLFEASSEISKNAFAQAREYDVLHTIIPELDKITNDVTRDICYGSEASSTIFKTFFHLSDFDDVQGMTQEMIDAMNDEFMERVVKRNNLDEKIPEIIKNSLKSGAAPVIVIPYKEVFELVDKNARDNNPYGSIESYFEKFASNETLLTKSVFDKCLDSKSTESSGFNRSKERLMQLIDRNVNKMSSSMLSTESKDDILELQKKKLGSNIDTYKAVKDDITEKVMHTLKYFDDRIEVVDPFEDKALLYLLKDEIKSLADVKKIRDVDYKKDDMFDINVNYHNKKDESPSSPFNAGYKHPTADNVNEVTFDYGNLDDFYIKTPDPDKLIPFRINDVSVGYWLIEDTELGYGTDDNKDYTSFTDIIKSLGITDDEIVASSTGDISINGGTQGNNPASRFANQFALGMGDFSGNQKEQERINMIKDMISEIVGIKTEFNSLKDNKVFNDALIDVIRTGHIIDKKIRMTFIPSHYVTYFSNDLDKNGLPKSLYHGTLFYCYLYISSILHSLLIKANKSSNKDIVEIDVGRHKNITQAVATIANALSTRNLHAGSAQAYSSLAQVFKNSMSNSRIIIPSYKGERMFNYTDGAPMNDISVDDEMTKNFLKSVIVVSNYPLGRLDEMGGNDYSRSVMVRELAYNRVIIGKKGRYGRYSSRFYKNCGMYTEFKNPNIKKYLDRLKVSFPVPSDLMVTNYNETIGNVKTFIDDLTASLAEFKIDRPEYGPVIARFKKRLIQEFVPEVTWDKYAEMFADVEKELPSLLLEIRNMNKVAELDGASGNGDGFGGGASYGGGDSGGGDDESGGEEDGDDLGDDGDSGVNDLLNM